MHFVKGHGTGNDFVLFSDPDGELDLTADRVRAVTARRRGIGADGVIRAVLVEHAGLAPELAGELTNDEARWFMDYRNADGSVAEMCGNGVRVFADFLIHENLAFIDVGETIAVGTRAGTKRVKRIDAHSFGVEMGSWQLSYPELARNGFDTTVSASGDVPRRGLSIDMGNPHVVVAVGQLEELARMNLDLAPNLEPMPEHGANIEYVVIDQVNATLGRVRMRVYERGVGETQSCGTGACAAALAVRFWAGDRAPNRWIVEVPGGTLEVTVTPDERVILAGPSALVATGDILMELSETLK